MFVLNPAHRRYVTDPSGYSPDVTPHNNRLFFAVWSLAWMLVLTMLVGMPAYLQWDENQTLRNQGAVTNGVILSREAAQPPYVRFRFTTDANRELVGQALGRRVYAQYDAGDEVAVRYLPNRAYINTINGYSYVPRWQALGVPLLVILTPLTLAWTVAEGWRLVRFRRAGWPISGEVVSSGVVVDEDGDEHLTVEYAFASPQSGTRVTNEETIPRQLNPSPPPATGTPVTVFYLNDRTYRLL